MANSYIIGYTAIEYDINGILIPKRNYTEFDKQHGKKAYTEVTEEQLAMLQNNSVFNTLIAFSFNISNLPSFTAPVVSITILFTFV